MAKLAIPAYNYSPHRPERSVFFKFMINQGDLWILWLEGRDESASQLSAYNLKTKQKTVIDSMVCECCSIGVNHGTKTESGIIAYRDRDQDDQRNISIATITNTGDATGFGFDQKSWKINGCPVNGPQVVRNKSGKILVSWYSEAEGSGINYLAVGDKASQMKVVGKFGDELPSVGRIKSSLLEDGRLLNLWVGTNESGKGRLLANTWSEESGWGSLLEISGFDRSRSSGFPTAAVVGEKALFRGHRSIEVC